VGFIMSGGSRVVVGRLSQRAWTAEDGSARQVDAPIVIKWTVLAVLAVSAPEA
jgi:single-stranded DNA-binding protein